MVSRALAEEGLGDQRPSPPENDYDIIIGSRLVVHRLMGLEGPNVESVEEG